CAIRRAHHGQGRLRMHRARVRGGEGALKLPVPDSHPVPAEIARLRSALSRFLEEEVGPAEDAARIAVEAGAFAALEVGGRARSTKHARARAPRPEAAAIPSSSPL